MMGPFASPTDACAVLPRCAVGDQCGVCKVHPKKGAAVDATYLETAALETGRVGEDTHVVLPTVRTKSGWWVGDTPIHAGSAGGMQSMCWDTLEDWDASADKVSAPPGQGVRFRASIRTRCSKKYDTQPEPPPPTTVRELEPRLWCAMGPSGTPSCTEHGSYASMIFP